MAEVVVHAEVRLWGATVGAVAELDDGRILFEYADTFRTSGLEISSVHLPLARRGPVAFDELRRKPAFGGLPGVLADALPDAFGNQVIRAYFASRGQPERALSPVQRLLYVGERAIGALTFHPAERLPRRMAERESLDIAALVRDARRIVEGAPDVAIPEIYRIGGSAGGMRPKALVLFDPRTRTVRSGYASPRAGERACLLKFDGVGGGQDLEQLGHPRPFNRVEAAYGAMARAAGLQVAGMELLEVGPHAHLLVERFDVSGGQRFHQHSLGGLLHVDFNDSGAASYEEYLRVILRLGLPQAAVEEGWRRMAFNLVAVNQDDHVKNLSFQMGPDGRWRLSPAYDLTFAKGAGWTARHQMLLNDKATGHSSAELLAVAAAFDIKRAAQQLAGVRAAVARWDEFAAAAGVPAETAGDVRRELEARARQLDG